MVEENKYGNSPLGECFDNNQMSIINQLVKELSEDFKFNKKLENHAIKYIYNAAQENYEG